jgi:FG-GAP repeat
VDVFIRSAGSWSPRALNAAGGDPFGATVALGANVLAVGAPLEDSGNTETNGNQIDNGSTDTGAAYVFSIASGSWSQEAYIKASKTDNFDYFGPKRVT